ncbi:MAG: hypothetical protein V7647_2394, partial [Acidobacteriota bacterium]
MRMRSSSRRFLLLAVAIAVTVSAGSAAAQDVPPEDQPIGRFVADVRGAFPKFKQDPNIATGI